MLRMKNMCLPLLMLLLQQPHQAAQQVLSSSFIFDAFTYSCESCALLSLCQHVVVLAAVLAWGTLQPCNLLCQVAVIRFPCAAALHPSCSAAAILLV